MIALASASILFTLLIVEVSIRFIPGFFPDVISLYFRDEEYQRWGLRPDENLGYVYAPDLVDYPVPINDTMVYTYSVSTVSLGYDNVGFRDDGIDGEVDAIVLGDSFAICMGVEMQECWVEILEKETGRDFANLGVLDYSPQQELHMLKRYGLPLKPKLVLWTFFPNDANDAWRFEEFGKGAVEGKFWNNPIRAWLAQNSVIYTTLSFFRYNRYLFYNHAKADGETIPRDTDLIWWLTHTDLTNPSIAEGFDITQRAILEANEQIQAQLDDAKLVVVIIPFREQMKYTNSALQPQLDGLSNALVDFCQKNGIPVVDLTPAMREKMKGERDGLYYQRDLHLNARGNEIVAELLNKNLPAVLCE
ncbi:MAG: SGNH/GDSL hydrolase family protein [Anaerolineae bacterium]